MRLIGAEHVHITCHGFPHSLNLFYMFDNETIAVPLIFKIKLNLTK